MDTCSSSLTNSTAAACAILNRSFVLDIDAVLKEEGLINFDDDVGDGGCKSDKISRDIRLLEQGIKETYNKLKNEY